MDIIMDGVDRPRRLQAAPEDSEAHVVRMAPEGGNCIVDKAQPSFHIWVISARLQVSGRADFSNGHSKSRDRL